MKRTAEANPTNPTIHDVARRAGVGAATVSRVLNGSAPVSEETRLTVMKAIAELNYSPSHTARKFSLGKTLIISILIPFFTRPSFVERLRGIDAALAESEYDFIVFNVDTSQKRDQHFVDVPRRDRSDGVIIISLPTTDADVECFARNDVPVVLVDTQHTALTSIAEDSIKGGEDATQHLIDLGHERIAYVNDILNDPLAHTSNASRNRLIGYRRALDRAGIKFRPEYHRSCYQDRPSTRVLGREMLSAPNRPTALFAASDTQALGLLEAARDLNIRVPEELSIVGYDDIELAEYAGLTTMHQALFESGKRGAELMLHTLEGSLNGPVFEPSPTHLVVRSSTCPPTKPRRQLRSPIRK